jgi:hypothetical protein
MPREPLPPEVARYLVERRVLVTTAEPGRVIAAVLGDTIAEIIQHRSAKGWWCTCQLIRTGFCRDSMVWFPQAAWA